MKHNDNRHGSIADNLNFLLDAVKDFYTSQAEMAAKYDRSTRSVSLTDNKKPYKCLFERPLIVSDLQNTHGVISLDLVAKYIQWSEYAQNAMKLIINEQWDWMRSMTLGTMMSTAASGQQGEIVIRK
jgi:hypothetical protein